MLRQSSAPLALCALFLASCNAASEDPLAAIPEPSSGETMPDPTPVEPPPEDTDVSLALSMSPAPASEAPKRTNDYSTLAKIYENMPWTRTVIAADGQGGTVKLELQDDGNGDADAFNFDSDTGEFTLLVPQDFERPGDADGDNFYELKLVAVDLPGAPGIPFNMAIADRKEIFEDRDTVLIMGATLYGNLGANVVSLGDIDQDGRPDIALGAPGQHSRDGISAHPPEGTNFGEVFVVSGRVLSGVETLELATADGRGTWQIDGTDADWHVGYSMAVIGDLDDDGIDDFVIARNETSLELISGATLAEHMASGGLSNFADISTGTVTLPDNHFIDPLALEAVGDLNEDGLPDLAVCMRRGTLTGNGRTHIVGLISGEGLSDILEQGTSRALDDLFEMDLAGGYGRAGDVPHCGPITTIGDVDADGLLDLAIPSSEYGAPGATVYSGSKLLEAMNSGFVSTNVVTFAFNPPFAEFIDDDVPSIMVDRLVTPLGDVTGDEIDDFGFGWKYFQDSSNLDLNAAFIVKGSANLLAPRGSDSEKELRALNRGGRAVLLGAAAGAEKLTSIYAMLPPENGLHDALVLARYSAENLYSLLPEEIPTAGTQEIMLPIGGAGSMIVPDRFRENFSEIYSIGDLNRDGYGDLAIGYSTASPFSNGGRTEAGVVWLVSGKAVLEWREQGQVFNPVTQHPFR